MAKKKAHGGSRKGAGRKSGPDGPTRTVAASVPESLIEKLDKYADSKGLNRSQAVTAAIRALVK